MATWTLFAALFAGLYMAWNIGANDVANAMGTSVGSRALTLRQAVVIAAVFELAGAVLVGAHVTDTVRKGIVDPMIFEAIPQDFALGMMAALLAAALWLNIATFLGWPVSTTHSIVGAVVGFGLVAAGPDAIHWGKVLTIVMSWVTSPLCGGLIAFATFTVIRKLVLNSEQPGHAAYVHTRWMSFFVFFILALATLFKGLKNLHLDLNGPQALGASAVAGVVGAGIFSLIARRMTPAEGDPLRKRLISAERIFAILQVCTACTVAFAHGSNDVANAVGPMAAFVHVTVTGVVEGKAPVPLWVLLTGGVGIAVGVATWGYRVIETVGKQITELTPSRGFAAEFGAACTILLGSRLGLPISTTHTLVGAVIGVGFARGMQALNFAVVRRIVASWVITLPFTGALAAALFLLLRALV